MKIKDTLNEIIKNKKTYFLNEGNEGKTYTYPLPGEKGCMVFKFVNYIDKIEYEEYLRLKILRDSKNKYSKIYKALSNEQIIKTSEEETEETEAMQKLIKLETEINTHKKDLQNEMFVTNICADVMLAPHMYKIKNYSENIGVIVMDYIVGNTLSKMLNDDILTTSLVDTLLRDISNLHSITSHGDLSPTNIIYSSSQGNFIFIDFGPLDLNRPKYYDFITFLFYLKYYYYYSGIKTSKISVIKYMLTKIKEILHIYEFESVVLDILNILEKEDNLEKNLTDVNVYINNNAIYVFN